jgi:hypothetical protein
MKNLIPLKSAILLGSTLLLMCLDALAQREPAWVDFNSRRARYPEATFLTGFYSEDGVREASQGKLDQMSEIARKYLIESVQVSIKSVARISIENVNRKTMERFEQSSVSIAKAEIVGLQYETFYNRKKRQAYAFVYARRADVIDYYQNMVTKKLNDVDARIQMASSSLASNDHRNALKACFEAATLLKEVEEAQFILLALGVNREADLKTNLHNAKEGALQATTNRILNSPQISPGDVGYYMAYMLGLQAGDQQGGAIQLFPFTYRDTGLGSDFSANFANLLEQSLVSGLNYRIAQAAPTARGRGLGITGTFTDEGNHVRVIANLQDFTANKTLASTEGQIPISWFEHNQLAYLPQGVMRANLLGSMSLAAGQSNLNVKVNKPLKQPLAVTLSVKEGTLPEGLGNIPIRFAFTGDQGRPISTVRTDRSGLARCFLEKVNSPRRVQVIQAEIDVAEFTGIDPSSAYFQRIVHELNIPVAKFVLNVEPMMFHITSTEQNLGRSLEIPLVEPKLKEQLAGSGFAFIGNQRNADFSMDIRASSRQGNVFEGIYFSFVDATVSVIDLQTGDEVYKGAFSNIKGAGTDFNQAGMRALRDAADQISRDMLNKLINN